MMYSRGKESGSYILAYILFVLIQFSSFLRCISRRTWEWEPAHRIRSFVPLTPLIGALKLLSLLGVDTSSNLQILPRLLFTLLAIVSDAYFLELAKKLLSMGTENGNKSPNQMSRSPISENNYGILSNHQCAFLVHILSWSMTYILPRTLGNSLETSLLIIGTSMLFSDHMGAPRNKNYVSSMSVLLAAVSVYCRPTAVLLWVSKAAHILQL